MRMYMTEGGMGRYAVRAKSARQATSWARRRHGTIVGEIASKAASLDELKEHLDAGAMFFDATENNVILKAEAQALAGRA